MEEMTFPYDKYGWIETVLAYRPLEVANDKRPVGEQLEHVKAFIDKRLGDFRVIRRVRVHKKWVVVGLATLTSSRLRRIQRMLDDEHALGVFLMDDGSPYVEKLAGQADGKVVHFRRGAGGKGFLWATAYPVLEKLLARIPEELGVQEKRRLGIAAHAAGSLYGFRTHLLVQPPWLTAADLIEARAVLDTRENIELAIREQPVIHLTFKKGAALRFTRLTAKHKGKQLGILQGGRIQATPLIREPNRSATVVMKLKSERTQPEMEDAARALARQLNKLAGMPRLQLDGIYGSDPGYQ